MKRVAPFGALVLLAVAVASWERPVFWITGFKPLSHLDGSELDASPQWDDREAPRFLAERNQVEIIVPRDMSVGELLRLYQLAAFPRVRHEIAEQEGVETVSDAYLLHQGRRLRVQLTPPNEGVP